MIAAKPRNATIYIYGLLKLNIILAAMAGYASTMDFTALKLSPRLSLHGFPFYI